jgi:hypothetical protein
MIQVLILVILAAILVFLSSFVSLQHTLTHHDPLDTRQTGKIHFLKQSKVSLDKPLAPDKAPPAEVPAVVVKPATSAVAISEPVIAITPSSTSSVTAVPVIEPPASSCVAQLPPLRCSVHPCVHYWNDAADCWVSPLRRLSGLSAPLADQRFIVFQPDQGGWNNIRMVSFVDILLLNSFLC